MDKRIDPWKLALAFRLIKAVVEGLKVRRIYVSGFQKSEWTIRIGEETLASRVQTGRSCLCDSDKE